MSRPSVLWINQAALLPSDGGGTRHFELGRELVRLGWQVTIVASDLHLHRRTYTRRSTGARGVISESVSGVDFLWVWAAPYIRNDWRRAWNWLSFAGSVRKACRLIDKPDIVIGSSPQLFAARAAQAVARNFAVPFVFEVRDLWPESLLAAGGKQGVAYKLLDRVARRLYRQADKILVLAQGSRNYLVDRGVPSDKFVHIPNGVDIHTVKPKPAIKADAANLARPFVLVYAGAHGPANGLDSVLDAAEILIHTDVRFLLIGDGPIKADLVVNAARRGLKNVEFCDAVSKAELASVLAAADAGLMVLRAAPLFAFGVSPNKLFDYLAAALPVVCNVSGEVAGLLSESDAGVQVEDTSGRAMAAGIRRLMAMHPDERRRKGLAGRSWVERKYSREVLGARLDQFLRRLVS